VDIAYITFVERFQIFLSEAFKYDITAGRPKLAAWIEVWEGILSLANACLSFISFPFWTEILSSH